MLSYFGLSELRFVFQMRTVIVESLKLCLLGSVPLYFQNYVIRVAYNPEQIIDSDRCKCIKLSGKLILHTLK